MAARIWRPYHETEDSSMSSNYDDTKRTPQEYEVLTGGGAESAEIAKRGISRRQMLRRGAGLVLAAVGAEPSLGALMWL